MATATVTVTATVTAGVSPIINKERGSVVYKVVKRLFDIGISFLLLIILMVPMIVIFFTILISTKEPPIFKQKRFGMNSREFVLFKFRTMTVSAPILANKEFNDMSQYLTTFGKFLRNTSLDEIPQVINILKGEMSFIGPRPLAGTDLRVIELRKESGADLVRPGITGLAQVNGRNSLTDDEKAAFDAEYVHNISFFTDLKIMLMTVYKVAIQDGIYKKSE
ncbi:UDP-phosphate galactose phosphotransferase [Weissella confusa]|nr:UDP-phosphate galactose phosphotransferase [Weissella confusa]